MAQFKIRPRNYSGINFSATTLPGSHFLALPRFFPSPLPLGLTLGLKWKPVNTVTNGPNKNLAVLTRGFLDKKMYTSFCQAAKKSGRNNMVTILQRWPQAGVSLYLRLRRSISQFTKFTKQTACYAGRSH